jgi:DNA mismatch endonuclease, patch repair protein
MTLNEAGPSFRGLGPASPAAREAARASSKKADTRCELVLRRALWRAGVRYRLHAPGLAGRPDVVMVRDRIVLFCDGDFWHGRDLPARLARLATGHNPGYWIKKLLRNVERDVKVTERLTQEGWRVLRLWETDILRDPECAVRAVLALRVEHRLR